MGSIEYSVIIRTTGKALYSSALIYSHASRMPCLLGL
jgi:hypothetical protein